VKQTLSESQLRFSRLGVAHDVDEQDVPDLELHVCGLLGLVVTHLGFVLAELVENPWHESAENSRNLAL
jgi:hypothetical protein